MNDRESLEAEMGTCAPIGAESRDGARLAQLEQLRSGIAAQVAAEIAQLEAIRELTELYQATDGDAFVPLIERFVSSGRDGTPSVSEFLCLEVGPVLGVSPDVAAHRIWQVLDLVHRHPELYQQVKAGGVRVWQADKITAATSAAGLSAEAARWVDARIAPQVARLGMSRTMRLLDGLIVQADPALAAERAEQELARREVRVRHRARTGTSHLSAVIDHTGAMMLDGMVRLLADHLAAQGDGDTVDVRRAKALTLLATPARALSILQGIPEYREVGLDCAAPPITDPGATLPKAEIVVHCSLDSLDDPAMAVCRLEGVGPVVATQLNQLLKDCRVTVRPVIDHNAAPAVDSYEIPDRVRAAVLGRTPVDAFPFGTRRGRSCDLDHVDPHRSGGPPGQTRVSNLTPLSRRAHRAKTAQKWRYTLTDDGCHQWTSPLGLRYVTGPDGTTRHDSEAEARLQILIHHHQRAA